MKTSLKLLLALIPALVVSSLSAQPAGGDMGPPGGRGGRGGPMGGMGGGMGRGASFQTGVSSRLSPHQTISANVNNQVISITYGRPYTKDPNSGEVRKVWDNRSLIPNPWRLGADEATLLLTPVDLQFGSVTIPAGAYTLYMTLPDSGSKQLVFSKHVGKWGIPVDTSQDFARVDLKEAPLDPANDQLELAFANTEGVSGGVTLKIMWDKLQYSTDFTVKN